MAPSGPHQLPTGLCCPACFGMNEEPSLPLHTQTISVTVHVIVTDEVIFSNATNAESLPLEVLLPLIFTFLFQWTVCYSLSFTLTGCLSLVEKICNKSGFAAPWWLPGLSSPHKDAVCSLAVAGVICCSLHNFLFLLPFKLPQFHVL